MSCTRNHVDCLRRQLREAIRSQQPEMIRLLEALVRVDSPASHREGIAGVAHVVEDRLTQAELEVKILDSAGYGPHVEAYRHGAGGKVLLLGHMDTVFPVGTCASRPFRLDGKRAFGPGVADMKGGIAVMIAALAALSEVLGERCPPVSVFLGGDEEVGSSSSRQHIRRIAGQCSATLVLEAAMPDGSLVHERKGSGLHHVKVQGRSAHAGLAPEKGANAIMALARALLAVEELGRPESGTTVNIARIEGGGNPGVVPDFAKALVNFRVRTKEEQSRVEQGLSSIASQCFVPGTTVTVEGEFHRPPMVPGPGFDELLRMVKEESAALGLSVSLASIGATNDANLAAEVCPAVLDGLGPVGGGLHSDEEYIEVDTLATKACLLALILARFAE